MNFLKKLFNKQESIAPGTENFWDWFIAREQSFHKVLHNNNSTEYIDQHFLEPVMQQLQLENSQFYCLAGMLDESIAELVITAEGDIKTFVFVEEFVASCPGISGWKFTALKAAMNSKHINIDMDGYRFNSDNIKFYSNENAAHPDEIDVVLVYTNYNEKHKKTIGSGCLIFLDNILGELNATVLIDQVSVTGTGEVQPELIPFEKLNDFLLWREKEFVEKYKSSRYDTANDNYAIMEAEDENHLFAISVINTDLLNWDATASHPWMTTIEITFDAKANNGMPGKEITGLMEQLEDELTARLPDHEGYLNIGRETYNGKRIIYFASNEFRNISKIVATVIQNYSQRMPVSYDIFKDKYWMSLDRFRQNIE